MHVLQIKKLYLFINTEVSFVEEAVVIGDLIINNCKNRIKMISVTPSAICLGQGSRAGSGYPDKGKRDSGN